MNPQETHQLPHLLLSYQQNSSCVGAMPSKWEKAKVLSCALWNVKRGIPVLRTTQAVANLIRVERLTYGRPAKTHVL